MNFTSQICTTHEQSERLLALGLKPETADMVYHHTNSKLETMRWELIPRTPTLRGEFWTPQRIAKLSSPFHKHKDSTPMTGEEVFDELWGKDVPAWSLSRILEMLPQYIDEKETVQLMIEPPLIVYYDTQYNGQQFFTTKPSIFENCITMISHLIRNEKFSKEYLT